MPKIITVTFSPCIDKSAEVKILTPEKKLKCSDLKSEPGGGGINIARVLRKFGAQAVAVLPSGGCSGKLLNSLLQAEKVSSAIIEVQHETRENFIVFDQSSARQFRFNMPACELSEKECRTFLEAIETIQDIDFIIASGSLPEGIAPTVLIQLGEIAQKKKAKFIVDTSGPALKSILATKLFMLKPNLAELAYLSGSKLLTPLEAEQAAKNIIALGHCKIIVVSLGAQGALLVSRTHCFEVKPPEVQVRSTVGAGDSMLAGIVYALTKGSSLKKSLCFGVACGTAATMNKGTELCRREDAESLYKIIQNDR